MKNLHLNEPYAGFCHGWHRYPDTKRLMTLIANHHGVNEKNILLTSGADQAIDVLYRSLDPGALVSVLDPDFPRYEALATLNRHHVHKIPFEGFFYPDINAIVKSLALVKSKCFITSTVSNPIGCSLPAKSVKLLYKIKPPSTLLAVDEVYSAWIDLEYDNSQFIAVQTNNDIVGVYSVSKLGFPGNRIGYFIGNEVLIDHLRPYVSRFALATPCIELAESIFKSKQWPRIISRQIENREWLCNQLKRRGLTIQRSAGSWVLVYLGATAQFIVTYLNEKGYLVQLQVQPFLKGWIRVSCPLERQVLRSFLSALDDAITILNPNQTIAA